MESIVHNLLEDFEAGKLNRRQVAQRLMLAATAAAASPAFAQNRTLNATGIHHVSYQVSDYRRTRDFYSDLLGMKVTNDDGKQCSLAAGDSLLVARSGRGPAGAVDHIAYAIDPWDQGAIESEVKRRGLTIKLNVQDSIHFLDPDGFEVQVSPKRLRVF